MIKFMMTFSEKNFVCLFFEYCSSQYRAAVHLINGINLGDNQNWSFILA